VLIRGLATHSQTSISDVHCIFRWWSRSSAMPHKFGRLLTTETQWKDWKSTKKSHEMDSKNRDLWNAIQATPVEVGTLTTLLR
jgi:hypothetical protein